MLLIFPKPITCHIYGIILDSITLIIFGEEYKLLSQPTARKDVTTLTGQFRWPPGPACWKIDFVCVCVDPLAYKGRWRVSRQSHHLIPETLCRVSGTLGCDTHFLMSVTKLTSKVIHWWETVRAAPLSLWRLTTTIVVVPHRYPLNIAFCIFIQQI